jgi:hypothetical protein
MVANLAREVLDVPQEQGVVIRIRAIPGIGEPKVLPDHDPIAITSVKESIVAHLADPIADHREVHVAVISHSGVEFARAISQHRFAEAPISAARDKAPAIYPNLERSAVFASSRKKRSFPASHFVAAAGHLW